MLGPNFLSVSRELPERILPLWRYAEKLRPSVILVCDNDARPIGTAIEYLSAASGQPVPAGDARLHYRRISRNLGVDKLAAHLSDVVNDEYIAAHTQRDGEPTVLVIDDLVRTGETRNRFLDACAQLGVSAETAWATYVGKGADFSCLPHAQARDFMPWRDKPEIIGIHYDAELQTHPCGNENSAVFYQAIRDGAQSAAAQL